MASTESPSTMELVTSLLLRLNKQLIHSSDLQRPSPKKESLICNSPDQVVSLYQIALETQCIIKMHFNKLEEERKGYEQHLQKLQDRLRKHAKNQCQMKIYCEFIEDSLKNEKKERVKAQNQLKEITANYTKQIQTLKTQLSNAINLKTYSENQKYSDSGRQSMRPLDTLTKIKMKIMNIGNIQISEPLSCVNTLRRNSPVIQQEPHPYSQPTSLAQSPVHIIKQPSSRQKQIKKLKQPKKAPKSKSKSSLLLKKEKEKDELDRRPVGERLLKKDESDKRQSSEKSLSKGFKKK